MMLDQPVAADTAKRHNPGDGRHARIDRSKTAILAACGAFIVEGDFQPTMLAICRRANVSMRTAFSRLGTIDAVRLAAVESDGAVVDAILGRLLDPCSRELLTAEEAGRVARAVVTGRAEG